MRGYGYASTMPTLLAEALGMTTEELYAAQTAGQTVAEIAVDRQGSPRHPGDGSLNGP